MSRIEILFRSVMMGIIFAISFAYPISMIYRGITDTSPRHETQFDSFSPQVKDLVQRLELAKEVLRLYPLSAHPARPTLRLVSANVKDLQSFLSKFDPSDEMHKRTRSHIAKFLNDTENLLSEAESLIEYNN